ncbi:Glucan 1,3-beta-glucosidase, partial [Smittium culicis]
IYRKQQTSSQIADKVKDMKSVLAGLGLSSIPVTAAETWPFYDQTLINAVDFIMVHIFPFWEGFEVSASNDVIFNHIYDLKKIANGKSIVVGETGWPTNGDNYQKSVPSIQNSLEYMSKFVCRSISEKQDYLWFAAMDTPWASTNNASNVEQNWGILKSDYKTPKYSGDTWFDCNKVDFSSSPSSSSSSSSSSASSTRVNSQSSSPSSSTASSSRASSQSSPTTGTNTATNTPTGGATTSRSSSSGPTSLPSSSSSGRSLSSSPLLGFYRSIHNLISFFI